MNKKKAKEKQRRAEKQASIKKDKRTPGYCAPLQYIRVGKVKKETVVAFDREWQETKSFAILERIKEDEPRWIRDTKDWSPMGKSEIKLIEGLLRHLYVQYPIPSCAYTAWVTNAEYSDVMKAVARGESLYQVLQNCAEGPKLSKKECHIFMNHMGTKKLTPLQVFRQIQCHTAGVCASYAIDFWRTGQLSRNVYRPDREEKIRSVIQWFGAQGMFNTTQAAPLMDYLIHKIETDATFSMKGRSMERLMQQKQEWHENMNNFDRRHHGLPLINNSIPSDAVFEPSGVAKEWVKIINSDMWSVLELSNMKALRSEGTAMHHCVSSYAPRIMNKSISIWSLRKNESRAITLEILTKTRDIVQARGACNRRPEEGERRAIMAFADSNNLRCQF